MGYRFGFGRFTALAFCSLLLSYGFLVGLKWCSEPDTARHEAGHAVAYYVGFGAAPHSMALTTFQLGGRSGYTMNCDGDDCRRFLTADDLWHYLVVLLAGMAATSSREGGDSDVEASLEVAAALLNLQLLDRDIRPPWSHDPVLRSLSSDDIFREAWQRAVDVATRHRRQVDALAEALLRRGSLDHEEIEIILRKTGE